MTEAARLSIQSANHTTKNSTETGFFDNVSSKRVLSNRRFEVLRRIDNNKQNPL